MGLISNEDLLKAIDILVKKRISELNFDKSVTGKIMSRKYNDGVFTYTVMISGVNYKITDETEYSVGTKVYINIPNGDISHQYIMGSYSEASVINKKLPIATTSTLGGIKVGSGLNITQSGILNTNGSDVYIKDTDGTILDDDLDFAWTKYIPEKHIGNNINAFDLSVIKDDIKFYNTLYDDYPTINTDSNKGVIIHSCMNDVDGKNEFTKNYNNYDYIQKKATTDYYTKKPMPNDTIGANGKNCYVVAKIDLSSVDKNNDGSIFLHYEFIPPTFNSDYNRTYNYTNQCSISIFDGDCDILPNNSTKYYNENFYLNSLDPHAHIYDDSGNIIGEQYECNVTETSWDLLTETSKTFLATQAPQEYLDIGEIPYLSTNTNHCGDWYVGTSINLAYYNLNYTQEFGTGSEISENTIKNYTNLIYYRAFDVLNNTATTTAGYENGNIVTYSGINTYLSNLKANITPKNDYITVVITFDNLTYRNNVDYFDLPDFCSEHNIKWGEEWSAIKEFNMFFDAGALDINTAKAYFKNIFIGSTDNYDKWVNGIETVGEPITIPKKNIAGKIYDSDKKEFKIDGGVYYKPLEE